MTTCPHGINGVDPAPGYVCERCRRQSRVEDLTELYAALTYDQAREHYEALGNVIMARERVRHPRFVAKAPDYTFVCEVPGWRVYRSPGRRIV